VKERKDFDQGDLLSRLKEARETRRPVFVCVSVILTEISEISAPVTFGVVISAEVISAAWVSGMIE
jgi:hypothetical protein